MTNVPTESPNDGSMSDQPAISPAEPTEPMERELIAPADGPLVDDDCYVTLAQVNLLRVRKQSDAALALCENALKRWPFRAEVHALVGDIYQETGRIDDAILRYCRVLELDPKNKANRHKLSDIVRMKRNLLGSSVDPAPVRKDLRVDRFVRAVILAMATVMLVTIMIAPVIFARRNRGNTLGSDGLTVDRTIDLSPIVLQPAQPSVASDDNSPAPIDTIRDPLEQALFGLMQNDKSLLQNGIQIIDVEEDPVNNGCTLTYLDRPVSSDAGSRTDVLRDALLLAQAASNGYGARDVRQFTLRCLLFTPAGNLVAQPSTSTVSGTTPLAFVGTIQRSQIPASDSGLSGAGADQLLGYFTNSWWEDGIN